MKRPPRTGAGRSVPGPLEGPPASRLQLLFVCFCCRVRSSPRGPLREGPRGRPSPQCPLCPVQSPVLWLGLSGGPSLGSVLASRAQAEEPRLIGAPRGSGCAAGPPPGKRPLRVGGSGPSGPGLSTPPPRARRAGACRHCPAAGTPSLWLTFIASKFRPNHQTTAVSGRHKRGPQNILEF